jgi:PAS domain S-box-containing protein
MRARTGLKRVTQKRLLDAERAAALALALDTSERLRKVLDRIDDGLLAFDLEQRYTFVNRRAAQLLGRTEADLLGRHAWTEFPHSVGGPFHRAYDEAMATQQPCTTETYFAPGGRWFEGRLFPSRDGLALYFSDITARKCAETALRVSELRFRLAAAQGQVWDWDLATGRVDFPAAFWEQLGHAPDSEGSVPPDRRLAALIHPEDLTLWRDAMREHLARRKPYDFEFRILHADGDWRWFHTQGQAVWDADGRATYMAGTTFEITDRKRAEAALRDSEAYRHSVFEQMADAVLLFDRQGRIVDGNPQALTILGYTRDELRQFEVRDILADFEWPRLEHEVRQMLRSPHALSDWEHRRKDGTTFPAEVSVRALDEHRFVAVVRDQTARRATENALLAYQFELSDLAQRLLSQEMVTTRRLAQALHDQLGQTLAVARLNLDACMLALDPAQTDPLGERIRRTAMLIDQAVREVRQVLVDLRPPLLEDQGLAAALENEIGGRVGTGQSTDILIEATGDVAHRRWPADVEYGAFMVAREAIANALQHAGASLVRIALDGDDASLRLDVIDDGHGIPPPLMHGRPGHLGIVGMRERSIAIGARFSIESKADGGTCVSMRWEAPKP